MHSALSMLAIITERGDVRNSNELILCHNLAAFDILKTQIQSASRHTSYSNANRTQDRYAATYTYPYLNRADKMTIIIGGALRLTSTPIMNAQIGRSVCVSAYAFLSLRVHICSCNSHHHETVRAIAQVRTVMIYYAFANAHLMCRVRHHAAAAAARMANETLCVYDCRPQEYKHLWMSGHMEPLACLRWRRTPIDTHTARRVDGRKN